MRIAPNAGTAESPSAGSFTVIGSTTYGTTMGFKDYSSKERDEFGNIEIVERGYTKLMTYQIEIERGNVQTAYNALSGARNSLHLFEAHPDTGYLNVWGYIDSFSIDIQDYGNIVCSLEVESTIFDPG